LDTWKYLEWELLAGTIRVLLPQRRDPSLFPFRFISPPWSTTALSSTTNTLSCGHSNQAIVSYYIY
jgi:hypothetical protein